MADTATAPDTDQQQAPVAAAEPETVSVNAGPPSPQPDTQTPSPTSQVQPTPTQGSDARVLIPQKRTGLAGIVDDFRNAIAGTQGRGVYIDPNTGEKFVQHPTLTGKQQWLKIAGEAFVGGAAGLAAGKGAGNMAKAPLAGIQAQQALIDKNRSQQDTEAEQDYSRQKQAKLAKANNQLLQTQIASNEFALKRMQVKAGEDDIKFSNDQEDREKQLGSSDLGVYPDHYSLADVKKVRPEFWKDHYQDDNIVAVPSFNQNGERNGVHLYLRQPGIGDTPVDQGTQAYRFVPPSKPGQAPSLQTFTPAGTHTQRDLDTYNAAAFSQMQGWQKEQTESQLKQSEIGKNKAEGANAYAEAGEHRAQAKALDTGPGSEIDSAAAMIANGDMAPSQLSKYGKSGYLQIMTRAEQIAKQQGKTFSPEEAEEQYKTKQAVAKSFGDGNDATSIQSFNQFLGHTLDLSESVNSLRNTNVKLVNTGINALKGITGNAAVSNFLTQQYAAKKEFENFLNNNHALHDDDIKEGKRLINEDMTPAQFQGALKQFAKTASIRMGTINDKYKNTFGTDYPHLVSATGQQALHHFGIDPSTITGQTAAAAGAPPGASFAYQDANGKIQGYAVNGKFVPVQ